MFIGYTAEEIFRLTYTFLIFLYFILSLFLSGKKLKYTDWCALVIILITAYFIGSRNMSVGTDTESYKQAYDKYFSMGFAEAKENVNFFQTEPIAFFIMKIGVYFESYQLTLILYSLITLTFAYIFCSKLSKETGNINPLSIFCCYLIAFYIINQQINILRAGMAEVFLLNFYLSLYLKNRKKSIFYGFVAVGTHFTSLMPIALSLVPLIIRAKDSSYFILFICFLVLSVVNLGILNVPILRDMDLGEKSSYLTSESEVYKTGFRLGFAIYNTFFAVLFYSLIKNDKQSSGMSKYLFKVFALLSCLFFACFQIPYSDRIGCFSWNIIPFLYLLCVLRLFKNEASAAAFTFFTMFGIDFVIRTLI